MTDRDATHGNERIAKAEFMKEAMRQTGCLAIEAAQRWEALQNERLLTDETRDGLVKMVDGLKATRQRLLCDCVTGRKGRRPEAGHDAGCATGLGDQPRPEPEPGTWAGTARLMAEIEPGFDWDAWKDEMKERDL